MAKNTKEEYLARIAVASPIQLVVINYEILLDYVDNGLESKEQTYFMEAIKKADLCLAELIYALDMTYEISNDLFGIYRYIRDLIGDTNLENKAEKLSEAKKLLLHLYSGWKTVEQDELSHAGDKAVRQVYAGLTYGKDGKIDEYIPDSNTKNYQA